MLLSAEPGDDPWQYYTWLGVPMLINTVPTAELVQLLQDVGLSVVSTEFESQLEGGRLIEYAWTSERSPASPSYALSSRTGRPSLNTHLSLRPPTTFATG